MRQAPASPAQPENGQPIRVHITGAARSGTTLMLALMISCFAIDGAEPEERRLWRVPIRGRRIVCTKHPFDEALSMWLARRDPNLHVIFMLRDPRETVVSVHGNAPDRYWSNLRAWRESYEAARPYLGDPRVHLVRYDELARDPDGVQQKLGAAMPFLEITHPFTRFEEAARDGNPQWRTAMGKVRAISPAGLGSWRKHLPRLKAQLARHGDIADLLIELGFETDKEWLKLLDGVEADTRPSTVSDRISLRKRFDNGWRDFVGAIAYGLQRLGVKA